MAAARPPIHAYPFPPPPAALRPWNPRAPEAAARVIALIAERLPGTTIEHVGSSAVRDCAGKGHLDFVIPYRDAEHLAALNEALFALGFGRQRNRDPFPETRPMRTGAFRLGDETFLLHVHVVPAAGPDMAELIAFRDRLRADPALVEEYIAAKRAIVESGVQDSVDYTKAKAQLFERLTGRGTGDG